MKRRSFLGLLCLTPLAGLRLPRREDICCCECGRPVGFRLPGSKVIWFRDNYAGAQWAVKADGHHELVAAWCKDCTKDPLKP